MHLAMKHIEAQILRGPRWPLHQTQQDGTGIHARGGRAFWLSSDRRVLGPDSWGLIRVWAWVSEVRHVH